MDKSIELKKRLELAHKRFGDLINERLKLSSSIQTFSAYLVVKINYESIHGVKLEPHLDKHFTTLEPPSIIDMVTHLLYTADSYQPYTIHIHKFPDGTLNYIEGLEDAINNYLNTKVS